MPRRWPRSDLDPPSGERLDEMMVGTAEPVGRNGRTFASSAVTPDQPHLAIHARSAALEERLGAGIHEKRQLLAHVRRLEAELRRSSAELTRLRGQLRGAVHEALTDPLTGLANRRSFDRELAAVAARSDRRSTAHLVIADIDRFKQINDAHGHDIGDGVLRIVGEIFLANVRRDSLVARLGGDEFGLLLPGASPPYAAAIAQRLCDLLASRPLVVRGFAELRERVTLSLGVAGWRAGETGAEWYARADAALYQAKHGGRNRVATDSPRQTVSEPGN